MTWRTIENPLFLICQNDQFAKYHFEFAMKDPPDELYHYTSGESLLAIINSQCLLATERTFLNDPKEFQWGLGVFEEYLNASKKKYSSGFLEQISYSLADKIQDDLRIFVVSLSARPDLLSQWRAYAANGTGVSIGFDGSILRDRSGFGEYVMRDLDPDKMPPDFVLCYHLLPVVYETKDQHKLLKIFIDAAHTFWMALEDQTDPDSLTLFRFMCRYRAKELLIAFKSATYKEESEWRLVATVHKTSSKINYRYGQFGVTPYVKLNISRREELPGLKLPITKVYVGPKSSIKNNTLGVEMLLASNGIQAPLIFSNINYR
ncbi:DUF2971 domain-containing protein [Prosthecobacter sp. SYSU 5D2]|uniref:DUF2971 domain-containing protein n=1 Tax=Prosthecobacter sp. SYSU 5D2 TaxID=3134134 RepID=UPI0031FEF47C